MGYFPNETQLLPADRFITDLHDTCGGFDVEPGRGNDTIEGHFSVKQAAGLAFTFISQNTQQIKRLNTHIRRDPGDHFFLIVQDGGAAANMSQAGENKLLLPGDMFLVDSTLPSQFVYQGSASAQVSLHLPRDEMEQRFGQRIRGGIYIKRSDPLGRAMRSVLMSVLDHTDAIQPNTHIAESFFSVFGSFLINQSPGTRPVINPNRRIVSQALNIMAQNYAEPDFSSHHVAQRIGISVRQLQRAFGLLNQLPPQRRLQNIRLEAAKRMLDNALQQNPPMTISTIAFACGFNDLSTFYRQFRQHYTETPSACLQRLR